MLLASVGEGISHLAAKIGKSVTYVQRRIKPFNLPFDILDSISNSSVSTTLAQELLYLNGRDKQSGMMQLYHRVLCYQEKYVHW